MIIKLGNQPWFDIGIKRHTWSTEGGSSVDLVDVPGSERVRGPLVEK